MEIQHYCYTRGYNIDYGNFSYPSNISDAVCRHVRSMARAILDDEKKDLLIPKWMLVKKGGVVVWGVCAYNRSLCKEKDKDREGRPIRGFFGVVISDVHGARVRVPFDIQYFKELYAREVEGYWDQREQHKNRTVGFIEGTYHYVEAVSGVVSGRLNADMFVCRSLGNVDKDGVVAEALALDEVSLVIDNDNLEQVTEPGCAFMNCLSKGVAPGEYPVKQKCPSCERYVSRFGDLGVCESCEKENLEKQREEEEMDKQMKKELENTQRKVRNLEFEIKTYERQLAQKQRWVKILGGLVILLFVMLAYTCRDESKIFDDKKAGATTTESIEEGDFVKQDTIF